VIKTFYKSLLTYPYKVFEELKEKAEHTKQKCLQRKLDNFFILQVHFETRNFRQKSKKKERINVRKN